MNYQHILLQPDILSNICSYLYVDDAWNLCTGLKIKTLNTNIRIQDRDQQITQICKLDEFTWKLCSQIQKSGSKKVFEQSVKDKNIPYIRFMLNNKIDLERLFAVSCKYCSLGLIGTVGMMGPMGSIGLESRLGITGPLGQIKPVDITTYVDPYFGVKVVNFLTEHHEEIFPLD